MKRKKKVVVLLLIIFLGPFGAHRLYLEQKKNALIYFLLAFILVSFLLAFIDFIYFALMSDEKFDLKYNKIAPQSHQKNKRFKRNSTGKSPASHSQQDLKMMKLKAKKLFHAYHTEKAIEQYHKILQIKSHDITTHFNLACGYSIMENADKSYDHLEQAIQLGYNDYSNILEHKSLAYIRLDAHWEQFVNNGFRRNSTTQSNAPSFNLIKELKKITELRDLGIIDNAQFNNSKLELLKK